MIKKMLIHQSIVYDFIMSFVRIANEDSPLSFYKQNEEINAKFKQDENIVKWLKKVRKKFPEEHKNTLDLFFNLDVILYKTFIYYVRYKDFSTVEEFIDFIKKLDFDDLLAKFIFLRAKYSEHLDDVEDKEALKVIRDSSSIMKFLEKTSFPANRKWEFLQICLDKDKWKEKLVSLFEWYNQKIFSKEITKIEKITQKQENELKQKITKYGKEYLNLLLNIDYDHEPIDKTLVFTVSYFQELAYIIYRIGDQLEDLYVFGFRHMEIFVERKHGLLSNVHLFKALGDETRQNMIKLLSQKEWYGDELAQSMELSNSTVSYHLSILLFEGFVKYKRVENRSYFSLNKDLLTKTVESAINRMILEQEDLNQDEFRIEEE